MKEENYQLHILRSIACLLVILMHSPYSDCGMADWTIAGIYLFTKPCMGLFFMISGALLLPVKTSYEEFIKRRLNKLLIPTLTFSVFYILLDGFLENRTVMVIIKSVLSLPFAPTGHGIFWFIYTIIGLYFLSPIISPFIERSSKKEIEFVLLLWCISLLLPLLSRFLYVRMDETNTFYSFSGYAGYFLLGYYLNRYPVKIRPFVFVLLIVFIASIQIINRLFSIPDPFYLSISGLSITFVCYQFVIQYVNTNKTPNFILNIIRDFSNCSFGIYLIQVLVLFKIEYNIPYIREINPYLSVALLFIVTTLVCWSIVHLIALTKWGKYIFGYSIMKK